MIALYVDKSIAVVPWARFSDLDVYRVTCVLCGALYSVAYCVVFCVMYYVVFCVMYCVMYYVVFCVMYCVMF